MTTKPVFHYDSEFGPDYIAEAQAELLVNAGFQDTSWHNDICPSFTKYTTDDVGCEDTDNGVRIWVNHADPSEREFADVRCEVVIIENCEITYPYYWKGERISDAITFAQTAFSEKFGGGEKEAPKNAPLLWAAVWAGGYEPDAKIVDSLFLADESNGYPVEAIGKAVRLAVGETLDLSDLSGFHTLMRVQ